MASIRISLLGGFAAHSPEGDALKLPTRKAEALVAFLACRAGEPQPRDRLAALLWGDRGDQQARHSLSQALSSVRGALDDGSAIFVAEREAVALRPDVAEVDVARLQGLGAGSALPDLRRAARLYRGPFLDGFNLREPAFEEWLTQERARLHQLALAVQLNLADRQASAGDWDAAVATLHEALALDLLAEEAHRRLIRLHLDRGSYNSAIRHYRLCADVLKKELGTRPEPSTAMLYDEAVRGLEAGHSQTSCNRACASGGACPLLAATLASLAYAAGSS